MSSDKTLGQIAYEANSLHETWEYLNDIERSQWEKVAQAVKAAVLPAWIKLSEATQGELQELRGQLVACYGYSNTVWGDGENKTYGTSPGHTIGRIGRDRETRLWRINDVDDDDFLCFHPTHFRPLPSDTPEIEGDGDDK